MTEYFLYAKEVERIITNLETTDQFKAANRRWFKEKSKEHGPILTVSAHAYGNATVTKVDADGDTVMAPTQSRGPRDRSNGDRKATGKKQKAKWVDHAERERRREERLCFRCGGSGHRIRECPYALAT